MRRSVSEATEDIVGTHIMATVFDCFTERPGLRGAMAFALALQSVHDLPEGHGETIVTATTAIVVLTVSHTMFHLSH